VTAIADLQAEAVRRRVLLLGSLDSTPRVEAGDQVKLGVDPAALRFFHLETDAAIDGTGA
jgi:hypothetical protein